MDAAIVLAVVLALFVAILLPFLLSGKAWKAAEDHAQKRRIADARMNARLLRLNL